MAFVSLQGGNFVTKERLRSQPMKEIQFTLQTYDSSSTVSKCPPAAGAESLINRLCAKFHIAIFLHHVVCITFSNRAQHIFHSG